MAPEGRLEAPMNFPMNCYEGDLLPSLNFRTDLKRESQHFRTQVDKRYLPTQRYQFSFRPEFIFD